ncbi:MAG: glycosyltransferase, partial [Candidatus Eisenbacteria bacterium]|nr:glycosyltransferase [Candidatus Latescibacterota bacterium]MBD3303491.1 glycosyltransferase [Candidatus Eisenbacteria bacterium]
MEPGGRPARDPLRPPRPASDGRNDPKGPFVSPRADLSVVILQHGGAAMTRRAVESFRAACGPEPEVVVVDNASPVPSDRAGIAGIAGVRSLLLADNLGFGAGNNRGAAQTSGAILLFLNNDTLTKEDFVTPVLEELRRHPEVGVVGPRIDNPNGSPQLSHGRLPSIAREAVDRAVYRLVDAGGPAGRRIADRHVRERRGAGWVTGAALFIRRELFDRVGGFDEGFFLYFEETDFCFRAREAGHRCWYVPDARIVHVGGQSTGVTGKANAERRRRPEYWFRSRRRYFLKRGGAPYA